MNRFYFILAMLLTLVLNITPPGMAGGEPVIAVAAAGETAEAQVSTQAARCPWFLLYDAQGNLVGAVANPHQQAAGGAGPQVVEFLAAKEIQTVIAGEFGGRMADALKSKGMTFRISAGTAADAVRTAINQ